MEANYLKVPSAMLYILGMSLFWKRYLSAIAIEPCQQEFFEVVKLLSLPNEILLNIFERIPVAYLVSHLPLICNRFAHLSEIVRQRVRCLTLIFGYRDLRGCPYPLAIWPRMIPETVHCTQEQYIRKTFRNPQSVHSMLYCPKLATINRDNSEKIVRLFPNVRALQLSADRITAAQLVEAINETILTKWNGQLEALHLIVLFKDYQLQFYQTFNFALKVVPVIRNYSRVVGSLPSEDEAAQRTVGIINRMPNLRRLVFSLFCKLGSCQLPAGQLELCLYSLDRHKYEFRLD